MSKKPIKIAILIVVIAFFYFVGKCFSNVPENNATTLNNVSEESFYNPPETYIEGILNRIQGVLEIEAATEITDENHLLGDECSSVVFFTYEKVDQTSFAEDEITPTAKGTDGGGCIEVFLNFDAAKARMSTLKMTKLLAGGSYRYGTVVIRTSRKLSFSEQKELETLILNQMAQSPPDEVKVNGE